MVWSQFVFGILLVVLLLVLSVYYGRQQILSLRRLRERPDLPAEESRYERRKAYRRLLSCGLTLLMAILLAVLLTFYEMPAQRLADEREGFNIENAPAFTEDQRVFLRVWGGTWIALLLVLMGVIVLAAIDLFSTRRYGMRQYRKLQADRRAMIERQVNRMRRERNGQA